MKTRKIPEFPSQRIVRHILREVEQIRARERESDLPTARGEIILDCILPASAPPEEMLRRGAATLALAETLVNWGACVGIVVSLVSDTARSTRSTPDIARYILKTPSSPMDLRYLAVEFSEIPLVHAVTTRTLVYR